MVAWHVTSPLPCALSAPMRPSPAQIKPLALMSAEEGLACLILMLGERGGECDATKIPIADISCNQNDIT